MTPTPSSLGGKVEEDWRLTVLVPAYNEVQTVVTVLENLLSVDCIHQIVVVDDGSTDGTFEAAKEATELCDHVVVVSHDKNMGKGAAIRTGLNYVETSHVVCQDADLEYNPDDISVLWKQMHTKESDVVFGSRYLHQRRIQSGRFLLQNGVRLLNVAAYCLYGLRLTDEATCYKMFRTSHLRQMNLQCQRFEFCPEVTAKAARLGLTIAEVGISYSARSVADGKKLRLSDGYYAIRELLSWRKWQPKTDGE